MTTQLHFDIVRDDDLSAGGSAKKLIDARKRDTDILLAEVVGVGHGDQRDQNHESEADNLKNALRRQSGLFTGFASKLYSPAK